MTGDSGRPLPNDEKLRLFAVVLDVVRANAALRLLFRTIGLAFFAISPTVPETFWRAMRNRPTRAGFWWGAGLSFIFCFAITAIWSCLDGTFFGSDRNRIYFSHDIPNLINYIVLCPVYVGLAVQLIVLLVLSWARLSSPSDLVVTEAPRLPRASIGIGIFLMLSFSAAATVNYMRESLDPAMFPKVGWWVARVTSEGSRVLSPLGIYYALLNFALLAVCIMAALAFLSLFFLCVRFGQIVAHQPVTNEVSFETIRGVLSDFTQAYIVMKLLAVTLVLNTHTWKYESPQGSLNVVAMNVVLLLFGVFFISVPRYYIELEWFYFREKRSLARHDPEDLERDDVRPPNARLVALVADWLFLSGFLFSCLRLSL